MFDDAELRQAVVVRFEFSLYVWYSALIVSV